MYTVAVERDFIARHFLFGGDWGDENSPIPITTGSRSALRARVLNEHGFLVDIVDIETFLDERVNHYRDQMLNSMPEFSGLNPSIEHFARIFCESIVAAPRQPLELGQGEDLGEPDRLGIVRAGVIVRIGLILYGNLDMRSGGFLYDRFAVRYLREQGDEVEAILLALEGLCARSRSQSFRVPLLRRVARARLDVLVQDELAHPSLFALTGG